MKICLRLGTLALATAGFFLFVGCASTVSLKPQVPHEPASPEFSKRIGIYHSVQFLNYRASADAYGNKHEFVFPIGQASDRLFRDAYPKTLQNFQYINANGNWDANGKNFDAVLEPQIDAFSFPLQSLMGPYWAEVVYRFNLYSLDRKLIFSWKVKGRGKAGDGRTYGEFGPIAKSVELAMENATRRFISSFRDIPELRRWALSMPLDSVTASQDSQRVRVIPELGESGREEAYDGVVRVGAELSSVEGKESDQGSEMKMPGVAGIRVFITNDGSSQILFDPRDFVFITNDNKSIDPVPGAFISAVLLARYGYIGYTGTGGGLGEIPFLIVYLADAAARAENREEVQVHLNSLLPKELHAMVLREGASAEGLVFFPSASVVLPGELKVPVVNLETATRYIVTIPIEGGIPKRATSQQGSEGVTADIARDLVVESEEGGAFDIRLSPRLVIVPDQKPEPLPHTVWVSSFKDGRPEPGRIGMRTAAFNVPMGNVYFCRLVPDFLRESLETELALIGYRSVSRGGDINVSGEVVRFWIETHTTLLYWDIVGDIQIKLTIASEQLKMEPTERVFSCSKTTRTYIWPSEELLSEVIDACMNDLMHQIKNDSVWKRLR